VLRLHLLQLAKFSGVLLFVGGSIAALIARESAARRTAVHRVASIGLVVTWVAGYLLARTLGWSLGELWITGAIATTLAIHLVLTWAVARDRDATAAVAVLLVATLALMIWKP